MSDAPTVGLALIVKDEAKNLPHLLASVEGAFDQVILVDTGSKDKTVEVFEEWARKQESLTVGGYEVHPFKWTDDFAEARTFADSFLTTDWACWADADDVIRGAENLRGLAADAPPDLLGYIAHYDYAQDQHGNCICSLKRERLVRRGAGEWVGRVHEAQAIQGALSELPRETVEWVHRKEPTDKSNTRNMRILRKWLADEPENARVLGYLGTEELARGKPKRAVPLFRRYLKLKTGWDEERAQVHRKLAIALNSQGKYAEAIPVALESLELLPAWPDSYLTLAESYHQTEQWAKAEFWAREVLRRGIPETLLIISPIDYTLSPRLLLASSLGGQGKIDEAIEVAEEALGIVPDHPDLLEAYRGWTAQRKREATAATFIAAAQELVAHDEQLKALSLLENSVPHYATDHPQVVQLRSQLRERLAELLDTDGYRDHYETASQPEHFIPDDEVDRVAGRLPRCDFLLTGLLEQVGVAA